MSHYTAFPNMHTIITSLSRQLETVKQPVPPSVSTRAFIQWLPDPKSEPTSTLVLTSSEKFFVDIRILLNKDEEVSGKGKGKAKNPTLSNKIDWAFAGRSRSTTDDKTGITSTRWIHTVDSRFLANPESIVDQAEMQPEDPESGLTLERSSMVNPATGRETEYVEGWLEPKIVHVPHPLEKLLPSELRRPAPDPPVAVRINPRPAFVQAIAEPFEQELARRGVHIVPCNSTVPMLRRFIGSDDPRAMMPHSPPFPGPEGPELEVCVVLRHENAARRSRGMVIRLGQFCQGVLQVGEHFAAERWEWTWWSGWQKVFSSSSGGGQALDMPCDVACHLAWARLRVGTQVRYGGLGDQVWQCVEEEFWQYVMEYPGRYVGHYRAPVDAVSCGLLPVDHQAAGWD